MTIAANSYAEYIRRLLGSPPIKGATRTIETPSVEPTADGYVGFCTNSREQFHSFLLLIDRPDLIAVRQHRNLTPFARHQRLDNRADLADLGQRR